MKFENLFYLSFLEGWVEVWRDYSQIPGTSGGYFIFLVVDDIREGGGVPCYLSSLTKGAVTQTQLTCCLRVWLMSWVCFVYRGSSDGFTHPSVIKGFRPSSQFGWWSREDCRVCYIGVRFEWLVHQNCGNADSSMFQLMFWKDFRGNVLWVMVFLVEKWARHWFLDSTFVFVSL